MNEQYLAPKQNNDLFEIIGAIEPNEQGLTIANEQERRRIMAALEQLGLAALPQTDESVRQGIADARWLVDTSNAPRTLKDHPFVDENEISFYLEDLREEFPIVSIDFPTNDPIIIAWNKVDGARNFDSWQGRGRNGSDGVDAAASSLHKILDFATKDTRLPTVELLIILTPDGPVTIASTSHRAAAAILRNEDIRCDFLTVMNARHAA